MMRPRFFGSENRTFKSIAVSSPQLLHYKLNFSGPGVTVKPYPVYDEELNGLTPTMMDFDGTLDVGYWIMDYPVVQLHTGTTKVRFIPYDLADYYNPDRRHLVENNPIALFKRVIDSVVATNAGSQTWRILSQKDRYSQKAAPPPFVFDERNYFILCSLVIEKGSVLNPPLGGSPNGPIVLLQLSKSAGQNLRNLILNKGLELLESDLCVSIVPVAGGMVRTATGTAYSPATYNISEVNLPPQLNNFSFDPVLDLIEKEKLSWKKIIRIPDFKEQVNYLCLSSVPPSAVVYAFSGTEFEEFLPVKYRELGQRSLEAELGRTYKEATEVKQEVVEEVPPPVSHDVPVANENNLNKIMEMLRHIQNED